MPAAVAKIEKQRDKASATSVPGKLKRQKLDQEQRALTEITADTTGKLKPEEVDAAVRVAQQLEIFGGALGGAQLLGGGSCRPAQPRSIAPRAGGEFVDAVADRV